MVQSARFVTTNPRGFQKKRNHQDVRLDEGAENRDISLFLRRRQATLPVLSFSRRCEPLPDEIRDHSDRQQLLNAVETFPDSHLLEIHGREPLGQAGRELG